MNQPLPPNVSERSFRKALDAFAAAIGREWVFASDEDRASYLDPFAPGNASSHFPSAALAPKSIEEIQAILKIAHEYRIPLWPVSTGKNLGYGGAAPVMSGTVVLELRRMNRILEVNEQLGYVVVEPGVTFFDLYNHLRDNGIKLWISPPAPGWGSVMGNLLDRGFGYTSYGDHPAQQCGMEVVLANGDIVRTGMGAIEGSASWQLFKYGYGPSWDGMFMQSNFGVVTKLGLWLMPEPEATASFSIKLPRETDLAAAIETLRPFKLKDAINGSAVVASPIRQLAQVLPREEWHRGEGAMPVERLKEVLQERDLGWWNVTFSIFEDEAVIDARIPAIEKAFRSIDGAQLSVRRWRRGEPMERSAARTPGLAAFQVLDWRGGRGGHIGFAPVVAPTGENAVALYEVVREHLYRHGFDYFGGFTLGQRHMIHTVLIIYDQDDDAMTANARSVYDLLVREAGQAGYGEYRAHITYMDLVAEQFAFNDGALMRLNETVKDALDPHGVLAPGKQGIWPKSLRKTKSKRPIS